MSPKLTPMVRFLTAPGISTILPNHFFYPHITADKGGLGIEGVK